MGAALAQAADTRIAQVAPAIEVVVVLAWATATFWFPAHALFRAGRHGITRLAARPQCPLFPRRPVASWLPICGRF